MSQTIENHFSSEEFIPNVGKQLKYKNTIIWE